MAKKFELKERGTGEVIYPVTSSNCVFHDGQQLDEVIENKAEKAELPNVIYERVVDEDNFGNVDQITREQLKKDLFIDLWNTACGQFGKYDYENAIDKSKPFYLNTLWFTYEEAMNIYMAYQAKSGNLIQTFNDAVAGFNSFKFKTIIPSPITNDISFVACYDLSKIEVLRISTTTLPMINSAGMLGRISNLRIWDDIVTFNNNISFNNNNLTFILIWYPSNVPLEYVRFNNVNMNMNLLKAPNINLESFEYLVQNRFPIGEKSNSITITIESNIYNALLGQDTTYPFNGGTKEEWTQLLQDAMNKDITFTTV